jgi:hypothetical protein
VRHQCGQASTFRPTSRPLVSGGLPTAVDCRIVGIPTLCADAKRDLGLTTARLVARMSGDTVDETERAEPELNAGHEFSESDHESTSMLGIEQAMPEVSPPPSRPDIGSVSRARLIKALEDRVNELFEVVDDYPVKQRIPGAPFSTWRVYKALEPFAAGEPLPTGVNETQIRFLATIAILGLGEQLDQRDGGMLRMILGYYTTEARLAELGEQLGGRSGERARQLRDQGITMLRDALPDHAPETFPFAFDKARDFPEAAFHGTGAQRAGAAGGRARRGVHAQPSS